VPTEVRCQLRGEGAILFQSMQREMRAGR